MPVMDMGSFIEKIAAQLYDTDISQLKPETVFMELEEWNSLTFIALIAMIDEEYGVSLDATQIDRSCTIEDLFRKVREAKGA